MTRSVQPILSTTEAFDGCGSVTVGMTSTLVVTENPDRVELVVTNDGDGVIYLALGVDAQTGKGVRLNPRGGSWTTVAFKGEVRAVATEATNLAFVEV